MAKAKEQSEKIEEPGLYDKAVRLVLTEQRASVAMLQRRLTIGYTRASQMLEAMQLEGIVSDLGQHGSMRTTLMTLEEWEQDQSEAAKSFVDGDQEPTDTPADDATEETADEPAATPATPTTSDAEKILSAIEAQAQIVAANELEWNDAKEIAASKKKSFDLAVEELRRIIRERHELAVAPLLPFKSADQTTEATAEPASDPDAWKAVPIESLLVAAKPSLLSKLTDEGITTFGALEDWLVSGRKIAGIGDSSRQVIDDARAKYFEDHPRTEATPEADTPEAIKESKKALAEVLDDRLAFADVEQTDENRVRLLALAIGLEPEATETAKERLKAATVAELASFGAKVEMLPDADVEELFESQEA